MPLGPGEEREIEFTLEARDFAFIGRDMKPQVEPGVFDVFVGGDSRAALSATLIAAAAVTAVWSGRTAMNQDAVRAVREDW